MPQYDLPETSGYLPNPGIGYQGYTHATAQIAESVEYRRSNTVLQGGLDWATMNPSVGVYNWAPVDNLLTEAAARGQRASFRVVTMNGEEFGGHCVPAWAVTEGAVIVNGEPDYRRRVYRQRWGQFVDQLAARYDGDPRIAFIDISGYGEFNEWQSNEFTDKSAEDFEGNGTSVDAGTRRHLVHMFVGGSGTTGVTETGGGTGTLTYSHPGFQTTQLIMTYGGMYSTTRWVATNYPHVGFRNDALFSVDATLAAFQAIGYGVTDIWRKAPVIFEPIANANTANYPAGVAAMAGMGASLLHDNSLPLAGLTELVAPLGYRYHCSQVQVPDAVAAGKPFDVRQLWKNTGLAIAYPRMGQNFTVTLAIANSGGTIVGNWTTSHPVSSWLPGAQQTVTDQIVAPAQIGSYTLLLGVVEQSTGNRILLPLASGGRTDNWYPAGALTVAAEGAATSSFYPGATTYPGAARYPGVVTASTSKTIALIVGNSAALTVGDTYLQTRLTTAGYTVTVRDDSDAELATSAYDGYLISETVADATVGTKYQTAAKPGIYLDHPLWLTHGLAASGTLNVSAGNTQWNVTPTAGLDAGLSGTATIFSSGQDQASVTRATSLPAGAIVPAVRTANTARTAYWAYDTGATMSSGTAPARRVAMGFSNTVLSAGVLTANGQALLDAAIVWAFGANPTTHTRSITDTIGITDTATRTATSARPLVDPVGITDTTSSAAGAGTRNVIDSMGVTDTVTRTATSSRPVVDPVGVTDSITILTGVLHSRAVTDTVGVSDSATRQVAGSRPIVDPVGITDQVSGGASFAPLNVGLWAVTSTGDLAPLPVYENLEISRERNGVGSISVDYPAAGAGFGHLKTAVTQDKPVEVEVWFNGARDGALRGLITQTAGDDLDGRAVWRFTGTFLEAILADGVVYPQPAPAERGELVFNAKNAGEIVATVLQQAQARGVLTGVVRDWSTALDSSGQSWPNTVSGLKYSPRTSLLDILQDLVDKDLAEFEVTRDRVLRLWAPDRRGVDRTAGNDPTLFRYGRVTSSPVRHSTRDTVTAVLAVGADGLSATASDPSAEARIGRRIEVGVDANNINNQGALTAYAQAALKALTKGQEELRHPLTFGPGDPRPKAGYDLADKVLSERAGGTRRAVDVQQWTLTAARQRVTGGEVILNDLIASRLQRLARQVDRITSGAAVIGTSQPPGGDDTLAPAAPTGLTANSIAYQDSEHSQTLAAVTLSWTPVTTNSDNTAADDVAGYQVQFAYLGLNQVGGIPSSNPEQTLLNWYQATPSNGVPGPPLTFGGVEAGARLGLRVAAFDNSGNQGAWSTVLEIDTASDNTPPARAAAPTLNVWFRTIDITSNGLDINGAVMPIDFDHDEIWVSRSATITVPSTASTPVAFDPNSLVPQHVANLFGPGTWNQPDIPVGVGYYAARRSVDRSGNPGLLSPIAGPVTAEQLVQIDIGPNAIGRQQIIDGEIVNAKIANLAVNDAKIETLSVGKLTAGTMTATVTNSGLFRTAATGNRVEFDSTGLRLYQGATVVGRWSTTDASMLMTGTFQSGLSGERINILPDGTMRFYPASGTNFSQIANFGNDLVMRGVTDGNGRSGRVNVNALGAGMNFSSEAEIPSNLRSEIAVFDRRLRLTAPFQAFEINGKLTNPVGGERRIQFSETNSSGATIAASFLSYQTASNGVGGFTGNGGGIKFEAGQALITTGGLDSFGVVKASDFVVGSTQQIKEQIQDARMLLDPLAAVKGAKLRRYIRTADKWRTPLPTPEDPNPQPVPVENPPVTIGVLAEEMPAVAQAIGPGADGEPELGVSVPQHLALLHGTLNLLLTEQQIVSTSGRVSLTSTLGDRIAPGDTIERAVKWDSSPPVAPTGGFVSVSSSVNFLGKVAAWLKPGSTTATGATVVIKNISVLPISPTAVTPVTLEVVGLGLFVPPYEH